MTSSAPLPNTAAETTSAAQTATSAAPGAAGAAAAGVRAAGTGPADADVANADGAGAEGAVLPNGGAARAVGVVGRRAMVARAAVGTSLAGGRTVVSRLGSAPPLTLRQTGPRTVHLVSTAAGPLGGDRLELDLDIAPGTSLEVGSVASTLVLPGDGESVMVITARVGAGATLRFAPQPTVLAAGCFHRLVVRLTLAAGAHVFWREEIVFGRYGEAPGRCHARFDATYDGRPLLRQEYTVGDPALDASPAVYGDARCIGTTLITPKPTPTAPEPATQGLASRAVVADGVAVLPLAGPGVLVSALGADAVELRRRLEWGEGVAFGDLAGATCPS
ncbi:urease accessory protein UreD [Nonomuraea sp. NPDC049141]|uniref:urease accessory protein UreD n=1 Tax=Nonomuraea sp. NPDC049141 TaxID=3155500 RepID=UPI003411B7B4